VWSAGIKYEIGPISLLFAHEIHKDIFGLSANVPSAMRNTTDPLVRSKDTASSAAIVMKFGAHQFEFDANQKKWDEPGAIVTGRARSYKNNGYLALWDARWSSRRRAPVRA
jgi:hypothetical protein